MAVLLPISSIWGASSQMASDFFKIDNKYYIELKGALERTERDYGDLLGHFGVVKQSNIQLLNIINKIIKKNDKVLDIGCGSAFLLYALNQFHPGHYYGIDKYVFSQYQDAHFSSENIDRLQSFCKKNGLMLINIDVEMEQFPFKDNFFDITYSKAVIEHFHCSPRHMLAEAYRTLRNGGHFILSTPNLVKIERRIRFLFGKSIYPEYHKFYNYEGLYTGHIREYTMDETLYAVKNAGFKILNTFYDINPPNRKNLKKYFFYMMKRIRRTCGDILFIVAQKEEAG